MKEAALAILALLVASCAAPPQTVGYGPDTLLVIPVDSIGIQIGDPDRMLGTVGEAAFTPEGNIAVLDEASACARVFSPDGRFLNQVGVRGSGPGELLAPGALAVLSDGSFGVMDASMGGVHRFSADGLYQGLMIDFQGTATPQWVWSVDNEAFVGMRHSFRQDEQGIFMAVTIGRWSTSPEPDVVYYHEEQSVDPHNMDRIIRLGMFSATFAAGPDGEVLVAPHSTNGYHVSRYSSDGTLLGEIRRNLDPVRKTEEEIEDERNLITDILVERGNPRAMIQYQPDPYRYQIPPFGLGLDGEGRIWVRNGTADGLVFDLYSRDGEHLSTARLSGLEDSDMLVVRIMPRGILAWSMQAPDYPKVYVMEESQAGTGNP
jgi:hypothetical protein